MARSCEEYARVIRQSAKFAFGDLLHHYLGDSPLVLKGEAADGSDITMRATDRWLEDNHAGKLGVTRDEAEEITAHVEACPDPRCREAWARLDLIKSLLQRGWPASAALASVLVDRYNKPLVLIRKKHFGEAIDVFKPFAPWFQEDEFVAANKTTTGPATPSYPRVVGSDVWTGKEQWVRGAPFGHCPACGSLGMEDIPISGHPEISFYCSDTKCRDARGLRTMWGANKTPELLALEAKGGSWNQQNFPGQDLPEFCPD